MQKYGTPGGSVGGIDEFQEGLAIGDEIHLRQGAAGIGKGAVRGQTQRFRLALGQNLQPQGARFQRVQVGIHLCPGDFAQAIEQPGLPGVLLQGCQAGAYQLALTMGAAEVRIDFADAGVHQRLIPVQMHGGIAVRVRGGEIRLHLGKSERL